MAVVECVVVVHDLEMYGDNGMYVMRCLCRWSSGWTTRDHARELGRAHLHDRRDEGSRAFFCWILWHPNKMAGSRFSVLGVHGRWLR